MWKTIDGFRQKYLVNRRGQIWSCHRSKILCPHIDRDGYVIVTLATGKHKNCKRRVHRLVLETFVGPCPANHECLHKNGRTSDNRIRNLQWGTRRQNKQDELRHGRRNRGARNGGAKLSEQQVRAIRLELKRGTLGCVLAKTFKVSRTAISRIALRQRWKHLGAR